MQRRHPNGGGAIRGDQAVVSPTAFVSAESSVFHGARVGGRARLQGKTAVGGTAVVIDAFITDSLVGKVLKADESYRVDGQVMQPSFPVVCNAEIAGLSKIENQLVLGDPEDPIKIWNSHLEDAVEVRDSPRIAHAHLMHYACVCGDAQVLGTAERPLTLDRRYHVDAGVWHIEPRYFEVGGPTDDGGIHVGVTECIEGRINLGCWCVKAEKLLASLKRHGANLRLARTFGWRYVHIAQLIEGVEWIESLTTN